MIITSIQLAFSNISFEIDNNNNNSIQKENIRKKLPITQKKLRL